MQEPHPWFLTARAAFAVLAFFGAIALVHAVWRSTGGAPQDPIRGSGPIY
jgi:hypothetical protein